MISLRTCRCERRARPERLRSIAVENDAASRREADDPRAGCRGDAEAPPSARRGGRPRLVPRAAPRAGASSVRETGSPAARREALHRRLLAAADVIAATRRAAASCSRCSGSDQPGARRARRPAARRPPVQGRRPLRPRPAAARALDARRGADCSLQLTGLYALGVTILAAGRCSTARLGGDADRGAVGRQLRRHRRRAHRSPAGWPARASPVERCLVIGEPARARADPREARREPRARGRRRHASARGRATTSTRWTPTSVRRIVARAAASTASSSRPTTTDSRRRRRADPDRQGRRRARQRAAADARGRRLGRRVRGRRRA